MSDDATTNKPTAAKVSPELLATFAEPGFEPVTVTVADLVTVRMDARYQVVEVALHGNVESGEGGGPTEAGSQVEAALRDAFNQALRQVMEHNAARLSTLLAQDSSEEPPASAS